MFDSNIKVSDLISDLRDEVDIALPIPDSAYVGWLNSLQQLIYREIIKDRNEINIGSTRIDNVDHRVVRKADNGCVYIDIKNISAEEVTRRDYDQIRYDDIEAVYADDRQLIKTTYTSGVYFPDAYFKFSAPFLVLSGTTPTPQEPFEGLCVNALNWDTLRVVYVIRPKLIEITTNTPSIADTFTVRLPLEFIDMAKAKLRGEAYKLANEDVLAAKWLNDYNVLLESFKAWVQTKEPRFGV